MYMYQYCEIHAQWCCNAHIVPKVGTPKKHTQLSIHTIIDGIHLARCIRQQQGASFDVFGPNTFISIVDCLQSTLEYLSQGHLRSSVSHILVVQPHFR